MVQKAISEGPSLFCEWAVGSSINAAMRKLEKERLEREQEEVQCKRDVIKLELTTDDESEVDSVRVTYPRNGAKGNSKKAMKSSSGVKQVRFEQGPLKPALKKKKKSRKSSAYESSGSDTFASETESGTDTTRSVDASTSEPSDSEASSTDTSSSRRRKSHKSRRSQGESSGGSDAVYDSNCSDCERDLAKKKAKERESRRKHASDPGSSTGSEKVRRSKKDEKHRRSKERRSGFRKIDLVEVNSDSDTSNHGSKKSRRGKENKKHQSGDDSPKYKGHISSKDRKSALSPKQKAYPEPMPGPHPRRPNLIRPIRAEVMQVEHTVEGPEDPRPNAFVDERNNVVRVYHGPAYGNPFGKLYPRRDPSMQPLPIGVPHPLENPYYHGFRSFQQHNHPHSPIGHMPTTLGDPYSSIPAHAPTHSSLRPEPHGHGTNNLTSGLWGIDSGPSNTTRDRAPSWSNNVGPPQPSASLRQANPNSRWGFGSSKKGCRKEGEGGSANDGWGKTNNSGWCGADNNGTDTGNWGARVGDKPEGWDNNGCGGGDQKEGSAGNNWDHGNDNTAGGDNTWDSHIKGGDTWGNNEHVGDAGGNQSPSQWDGGANNNSWKADNNPGDSCGNANGNNDTWEGGTDNASNNVGPPGGSPPGQQSFSPSKNHVPGAWDGTPQAPFPSWGDPTAAQSRQNHHADGNW